MAHGENKELESNTDGRVGKSERQNRKRPMPSNRQTRVESVPRDGAQAWKTSV